MTAPPGKGERARAKLVDATAQLLRRQGYHATGLSDIVAESGAPRGSLYHYFPGGKDELAVAALRASGVAWRARVEAAIAGVSGLGDAIDAIVRTVADDLEASGWDNGCPVAAVALESTSEAVREAVADHFRTWQASIVDHLGRFGVAAQPARELAQVAMAMMEGALLLARVARSRAPLDSAGRALRGMAGLLTRSTG